MPGGLGNVKKMTQEEEDQ
jgi:nucleosome assembly protein 1-like 1